MNPELKLTKEMIAKSRVIARGRAIRDVQRLAETHGGEISKWLKKSSPRIMMDGRLAEIHWYECHGIGRFELKIKWL